MTFEEFLARLSGVSGSGSRRTAKCPAHDDRNPSLSICLGDDGHKLVKCHAGAGRRMSSPRWDSQCRP